MQAMVVMVGALAGLATVASAAPAKPRLTPRPDRVRIEISDRQARELPSQDLAHRVLGAVGDLVVAVDRPAAGASLTQMIFYAQPEFSPVGWDAYRPISGMCSITELTVRFSPVQARRRGDGDAHVVVDGIRADARFGLPAQAGVDRPVGGDDAACRDPKSAYHAYFSAPDSRDAWTATRYVQAIAEAAAKGGAVPFAVTCEMPAAAGACDNSRKLIEEVQVANISYVDRFACPEGDRARDYMEIGVNDAAGLIARSGASLWRLDIEARPGSQPKILSVKLDLGLPEIAR
jgi:hypothetical protein